MLRSIFSVFLLFAISSVSPQVWASPITAQMQQDDARLKQPVSLDGYRLYVGDFFDQLSGSTKIALITSGKSVDTERISVGLHGTTVADVMNAVRSVLSYQGATYEWSRQKTATGEWQYLLTGHDRDFKKQLELDAKKDIEEQINQMLASLRVAPEERRRMEKANPLIKLSKRGEVAIGDLKNLLSPEQIHEAVFDGKVFNFDEQQMKAMAKNFLDSERDTHNNVVSELPVEQRSMVAPYVEPKGLQVLVKRADNRITYDLWIFGKRGNSIGGYGWAGGMPAEAKWRKNLGDMWRTGSDSPVSSDVLSRSLLPSPLAPGVKVVPRADVMESQSLLYMRLRDLAEKSKTSFVAKINPTSRDPYPGIASPNETVAKYLATLAAYGVDCKSVSGVLLFTTHQELFDSVPQSASWQVVKQLRLRSEKDVFRSLRWEDYCLAARGLTVEQLRQMPSPEQWRKDRWSDMLLVLPIQPLLAGLSESLLQAAQNTEGVAIADLPLKARVFITQNTIYDTTQTYTGSADVPKTVPVFLRLTSTDYPLEKNRLHELQLLDRSGKTLFRYGFRSSAWPPPTDEEAQKERDAFVKRSQQNKTDSPRF